ncbi:MAG: hypothetical protein COB29_16210 [Sulfitobacter sp.]|nr:MAG: hypothetical protein COB29_16210 [Sulfitobacter sp.]
MTDKHPTVLTIEELAKLVKEKASVQRSLGLKNTVENIVLDSSPGKKAISLRLDTDVIDWFKSEGKGYQSRINAVLRAYMRANI